MEIRATLKPGVNGTKELVRKYGDQLVCVRYRCDKKHRKRYKTVELIIEEKDWLPQVRIPARQRVPVRIGYGESDLRELVKQSGGYWNPDRKAWYLEIVKVLELGLDQRILDDEITF
jgi:hypothetical protein